MFPLQRAAMRAATHTDSGVSYATAIDLGDKGGGLHPARKVGVCVCVHMCIRVCVCVACAWRRLPLGYKHVCVGLNCYVHLNLAPYR